jgi:hypothetical protein
MTEPARITHPVLLIRVPQAYRAGMSDLALYEATRGVWKIGPRRDQVRYALAVYEGMVKEVYEIAHWQPARTTAYTTRKLDPTLSRCRWEFVGTRASEPVRQQYVGKSVAMHFKKGAQNPITYVNVPE